MNALWISQQVHIQRTDGRMQNAVITKLDGGVKQTVTVEWYEDLIVRGKEVPLAHIIRLNSHLFGSDTHIPEIPESDTHSVTKFYPSVCNSTKIANCNSQLHHRLNAAAQTTTSDTRIVEKMKRIRDGNEKRREQNLKIYGRNCEIATMIRKHQDQMRISPLMGLGQPLKQHQIVVCVRKRPLNKKEINNHDVDVVTVASNELLVVHEPRKQVNLNKYLDNHNFRFDYTFNEDCTNSTVFEYTAKPLVHHIFTGGMATCFAYGQTGTGKTHTMGGQFIGKMQNCSNGIYAMTANAVFDYMKEPKIASLDLKVMCTFFEIYGSRIYDLLVPGKPQLRVLEDGNQKVQILGLAEMPVNSTEDVLNLIELGYRERTCGKTAANSNSSRSHAVFQIVLRSGSNSRLFGQFSMIDLAGNERGADNCASTRHTMLEGAEINKSLLALKECIRALGCQSQHLPFRGSKLTQVLRDSFIGGKKSKTCMIAMITPGLSSCEHTLNTLRYADRVKELSVDQIVNRSPRNWND